MASTSHDILIDQLTSSSLGEFSPALLSLRRWCRSFWKRAGIGLLSLWVVLNLTVELPNVGAASVVEASAVEMSAVEMSSSAALGVRNHPLSEKSVQDAEDGLAQLAAVAELGRAHPGRRFGLGARMTHYRVTRSRLSIPHDVRVSSAPEKLAVNMPVKVAQAR